jgi:hypothetical protein
MRGLSRSVGAVAMVVGLVAIAAASGLASGGALVGGTTVRGGGPSVASTTTTSTNWGGYAALASTKGTSNSVSEVQGSWVQPTANCASGKTTYASVWVGIDGYSSTTVEQIGTDSDCHGGTASYYAWYEFFPANSVTIGTITVHAGDRITGQVTWTSGSKFTLKITDTTRGQTFSRTGTVASAKRSSAEWIVETPEICSPGCTLAKLTKYGVVSFTSCEATISASKGGISSFPTVYQINIKRGGVTLESTSALKSPTAFSVTWKAYS